VASLTTNSFRRANILISAPFDFAQGRLFAKLRHGMGILILDGVSKIKSPPTRPYEI
jgi:hypothetical protein